MTPTTELVVQQDPRDVRAEDFLPVLTVQQAVHRKGMMNQFISEVLRETKDGGEGDYGQMPGGQKKKILFKPGAEKLCSIFGLAPQYLEDKIIEDWTGESHGGEPLFYYSYRCQLSRGGRFMGEAIGSCNSWESKYRYRWVAEDVAKARPDFEQLVKRGGTRNIFEPAFALEKRETTGKYGKPAEYWARFDAMAAEGAARQTRKKLGNREFAGVEITVDETQYRIPNPDVADVINTCQKMAQKRALVAAVLVVTNCSDAFTQDIEDFTEPEQSMPAHSPEVKHQADAPSPLPSGRAVPDDLSEIFKRIATNPKHFQEACILMEKELVRRGGDAGQLAYENISDRFHKKYAGLKRNPAIAELQDTILDLWDALQTFPEKEPE